MRRVHGGPPPDWPDVPDEGEYRTKPEDRTYSFTYYPVRKWTTGTRGPRVQSTGTRASRGPWPMSESRYRPVTGPGANWRADSRRSEPAAIGFNGNLNMAGRLGFWVYTQGNGEVPLHSLVTGARPASGQAGPRPRRPPSGPSGSTNRLRTRGPALPPAATRTSL